MKPKPTSWIPGTRIAKPASRLAMDDGRITVPTNKLGIYTCGHLFCLSCTWGFLQKSEWLLCFAYSFYCVANGVQAFSISCVYSCLFPSVQPVGFFR